MLDRVLQEAGSRINFYPFVFANCFCNVTKKVISVLILYKVLKYINTSYLGTFRKKRNALFDTVSYTYIL